MGIVMPLTIPDSVLKEAGLTEQQARIEIACRLFQANRLSLWQTARYAGITRVEAEAELLRRGIALYALTEEQLNEELAAMDRLGIPG